MTTTPQKIYTTSTNKKIIMFICAFFGSIIGIYLAYFLFNYRSGMTFAAVIGISIGVVLASSLKFYTSSDRLIMKPFFGKPKEFLFSEGTFTLETIKGAKAFFMAFAPTCMCLTYAPKSGGKKMSIAHMLDKKDIESLYQEIQQKAGK